MSREGYIALAHLLRDIDIHAIDLKRPSPDRETVETIARVILWRFGIDNPMFPHNKFMNECGFF